MITTTLNRIREHSPCVEGWTKLLSHLGKTRSDDEPLPYSTILDAVGLNDTLWCLRAEPQHAREWRLFAVWCARQVQDLMTDPRSVTALGVAERHAHGEATDEELRAAEKAADAASAGLSAASYAAGAAFLAAGPTAAEAAKDAARQAADARAVTLPLTGTAWDAAWAAQEAELRRVVR
jgi:hypothetical protein